MASPETDSGFVGSEASRVSPLTQTPEHRLSHTRYPGDPHHCRIRVTCPGWLRSPSSYEPDGARWPGHSQSSYLLHPTIVPYLPPSC